MRRTLTLFKLRDWKFVGQQISSKYTFLFTSQQDSRAKSLQRLNQFRHTHGRQPGPEGGNHALSLGIFKNKITIEEEKEIYQIVIISISILCYLCAESTAVRPITDSVQCTCK
jgi:hypothetical protein